MWFGLVCFDLVWYGMHGMVGWGLMWCGVVWYGWHGV